MMLEEQQEEQSLPKITSTNKKNIINTAINKKEDKNNKMDCDHK